MNNSNENNSLIFGLSPLKKPKKSFALSSFLNTSKNDDNSIEKTQEFEKVQNEVDTLMLIKKDNSIIHETPKEANSPLHTVSVKENTIPTNQKNKIKQLDLLLDDLSKNSSNLLYKGTNFDGSNPNPNIINIKVITKNEKETITNLKNDNVLEYSQEKDNEITLTEINIEKLLYLLNKTIKEIDKTKKTNEQYKKAIKDYDKELKEKSITYQELSANLKQTQEINNKDIESLTKLNTKMKIENEKLRNEIKRIENDNNSIIARYDEDISIFQSMVNLIKKNFTDNTF